MQDFTLYNGLLSKLSKKDLNDLFIYLQNYKLKRRDSLNFSDYYSFGIEVEFEQLALNEAKKEIERIRDFKYWLVHEEKSVREIIDGESIGGEISTPILHNTKKDWQKLFRLYKILNSLGAVSTNRCALHIHVGAQIFGEDIEYLKRFIKVWCIFEDIIFRFGYQETKEPRPNIGIFCTPLAPVYREIIKKKPYHIRDASTPYEFNFGKRNAVAFHNYHYLSSDEEVNNDIEIRCPSGTLNPIIVENNVNFFINLMLYVKSDNYDEKLINRLFKKAGEKIFEEYSILDFKKALMLSDLIFSNNQDKIDFLRGYVKDSDILAR